MHTERMNNELMKTIMILGSAALMLFAGFTVHNTFTSAIAKQQAIANRVLTDALGQ